MIEREETESMLFEKRKGTDKVVIFFGGGKGGRGIGLTPFEFLNLTRDQEYNKIFFKDVNFSFYHRGFLGHTDNIEDSVKFLKKLIKKNKFKHVTTVGNSAGGFGAMVFGARIGADIVQVFSPVTRTNLLVRIPDRDPRNFFGDLKFYLTYWGKKTKNVNSLGLGKLDTTFFLHYCTSSRLDAVHAQQVKKSRNVFHLNYPCDHHKVAKYLKDRNYLLDIINSTEKDEVMKLYRSAVKKKK